MKKENQYLENKNQNRRIVSKNSSKEKKQRSQNVQRAVKCGQVSQALIVQRKSRRIKGFAIQKNGQAKEKRGQQSDFSPLQARNRRIKYDKPLQSKRRMVIELCTRSKNPLKQIQAARQTGLHESTVRMILKLWKEKGKLSVSASQRKYKQAVQLINQKHQTDILKLIGQSERSQAQHREPITTPLLPTTIPKYRQGLNYVVECPVFVPHPQDHQSLALSHIPILLTAGLVHPQVLEQSMSLSRNNNIE